MRPAYVVTIQTPKLYLLDGLWFGPKKAKRAFIFVHGLTSSAFTMAHVLDLLVDKKTAVLTFNNRGFKIVSDVKRLNKDGTAVKWRNAGAAHEVFTECTDDLQGAANFAREQGAKEIYFVGHSTGCQKSIYWAYKNKPRDVRGIIMLGPLSDYASALAADKNGSLKRAVSFARSLVKRGKPHELMPKKYTGPFLLDAQRFLSLSTPDSAEEIFSYARQSEKRAHALESVKIPLLVFLAGNDEHAERSAQKICEWFERHIYTGEVVIIPNVRHSFKGAEKKVASAIHRFMKES
ncbi:MAG TPA: alpha/beta fold hydrolase [Candidatus Paceibacterota bacterium]